MIPLPLSYYETQDVVGLARDLIGKLLVTQFGGKLTIGRIIETEAYQAPEDQASHAFQNKRTVRNAPMYESGGIAYVYLCYGIHHLFNIVTGPEGIPHAILIRGILPVEGEIEMLLRRGKSNPSKSLGIGPGSMSQAMGITTLQNKVPLLDTNLFLSDDGKHYSESEIRSAPRVGIPYAGDWMHKPWRFLGPEHPEKIKK